MADDIVINLEKVCKRYTLKHRGGRTLKAAVIDLLRGRRGTNRDFWALKDISFQVKAGQTVGIIGANGAGKSTLLGLISRTSLPTSGHIDTRGTISSLLELGAGFHPDLSGRENVYLYGAIMGISRRQMQSRFDETVAFAGLSDWIDEPVKHYSSGMYVRLGFAVAVEVDPAILIIDEVLAVGDVAFQRKCMQRIEDFKRRGKTMIVVSHDLSTIRAISDQILLLDNGRIVCAGDPNTVVTEYQWLSRERHETAKQKEWGTREVLITEVEFFDEQGMKTNKFRWNGAVEARIHFDAIGRIPNPVFGFALHAANGLLIYGSNTQVEGFDIPSIEGKGCVRLRVDRLAMATGAYLFSFSVHSPDHLTNYHRLDNKFPIAVECEKNFEGCAFMPVQWSMG